MKALIALIAALAIMLALPAAAADTQAEKDARCGASWSQTCYLKPTPTPRALWNTEWTRPEYRYGLTAPAWRAFQILGGEGNNVSEGGKK